MKQIKTFERRHELNAVKRTSTRKRRRHIIKDRKSNLREDKVLLDDHKKERIRVTHPIPSFMELKDALLSGTQVKFTVNITECISSGEDVSQSSVFGGSVDVFEIDGDAEKGDEVLRFSASKRQFFNFGECIKVFHSVYECYNIPLFSSFLMG